MTPGQQNRAGVAFRTFDPAGRMLRCFACHSTGPLTLGSDDAIVPRELGVRCEVCHGPGSDHARDPARNHPRNPARMTAAAMNTFCGQCHGLLITGDAASDLRQVSAQRAQSNAPAGGQRVFRKSQGRLNCVPPATRRMPRLHRQPPRRCRCWMRPCDRPAARCRSPGNPAWIATCPRSGCSSSFWKPPHWESLPSLRRRVLEPLGEDLTPPEIAEAAWSAG